jgi:hypothetical protein
MNEDLQFTDEQLRLITSRKLRTTVQLDSETAASRDTFLALGSALETAAGDFDEAALVSQLQDQPAAISVSREQACSRSFANRTQLSFIIAAVLAACALIAIVRTSILSLPAGSGIAQLQQASSGMDVKSNKQLVHSSSPGWNDPLDDEIAVAALAIDQISGRSRGFDSSMYDMNLQLEALSQELLSESL